MAKKNERPQVSPEDISQEDCDNLYLLLFEYIGEDSSRGHLDPDLALVITNPSERFSSLESLGIGLSGLDVIQQIQGDCPDKYIVEVVADGYYIFPAR